MPYLAWDNKAEAQHLADHVPYHFLELDHFYGDIVAGNKLIRGDNILVLKALLPFYANKIKCIYIDPPYNTQSNFDHYDDAMAHDDWLSMMYPRLVLLKQLLAADGSIWVSINDRESHYLKVLMDEVFGREHFLANITWQTKSLPEHKSSGISQTHDHILGYRASVAFQPRLVHDRSYKSRNVHNPDQDPRGPWLASPLLVADNNPARFFAISNPHGHLVYPPKHGSWKRSPIQLAELERDGRIWWGKLGKSRRPAEKVFVSDMVHGMVNQTWWSHEFAGCSAEAEQELMDIFKGELFFDTPKPEKLIARIVSMATERGDWVLDCFLGSGTTAAVAHKMGRHYIGVERGEHAQTHCASRLQKVIDGEQGGISRLVGWKGGGGFQLFQLGQPMFLPDGQLSSVAEFQALAAYLWLLETGVTNSQPLQCPLLGVYQGTAYYLLFNHAYGGDVLSADLIEGLLARYPHDGPKVIYADNTLLPSAYLSEKQIWFKSLRQVITTEVA